MSNLIEDVRNVMKKNSEQHIGMFTVKSANLTLELAARLPIPRELFRTLWYEGEVSCLFADSNLGKSILAVQIGNDIARQGLCVTYFDLELSDKQFQMRYTNEATNALYDFSDTFFRVEINRETLTEDFENALFQDMERVAVATQSTVIIVDNLTWLCGESEKGGDAADLMRRLMALKFKHNWSILVIAHTPKRDMTRPITANDLAGSKKLFNFFDSVFAIGRSAKDESLRYIKQIKCRYGEFTYGSDNVITTCIEKKDAYLHFVTLNCCSEYEHLKIQTEEDQENLRQEVVRLKDKGWSYRNIAAQLGITASKVQRILAKNKPSVQLYRSVSLVSGDTCDTPRYTTQQ